MRANRILFASLFVAVFSSASLTAAETPAGDRPEITVPESVRYFPDLDYRQRPGQAAMQLDLACPKAGDGPFPAVLIFHGGAWMVGNRQEQLPFAFALAERGYVAVTVSYHFYYEAPYPAAIHDA